jgi:ribose-phosphate pyrophosphokinase
VDKLKIFTGNSNKELSEKIANYLGKKLGDVTVSNFCDGETLVKINENIRGHDVFLVQSTCAPVNQSIMELLVMIDAFKRASARRITVVIPYYGYARQDRKDQPRVPITAKLVSNLYVSAGVDRVLTMDLHADQIQGFFDIPLDNLYAAKVLADYFKDFDKENLVVVSPDVGGIKVARAFAKRLDVDFALVDKARLDSKDVEVLNIIGDVEGKNVILVDDMISTAGSIAEAARVLKEKGANDICAAVTHGILSGPAIERINNSCLKEVIITDTIPLTNDRKSDKIKVLSVANLLAEAIKRIHKEESVSYLFI